jgi:predicted deacetylase
MSAQYLIRFDDICPTMNWAAWSRIESVLLRHDIKPLLAVVPDNLDSSLAVGPARSDFWDYIRSCQARGWTIAMHGCHHLYETRAPGLLKINRYSEFSGLPYEAQREKIVKAAGIFASQEIRVQAWIAPGHNFDATTLQILKAHGIDVLSDGFYFRPVKHLGLTWLPQQLWRFRAMPFGLWTVCFHHNAFTDEDIQRFEENIQSFRPAIVDFPQALSLRPAKALTLLDRIFSALWRQALISRIHRRTSRSASDAAVDSEKSR